MSLAAASWPALGTTASVLADGESLPRARTAVEEELAAIDRACSRFRDDSELMRVNRSRGRRVPIGPLLVEALQAALRAAASTGGDVDPTVGRALVLSGYDRDFARLAPSPRVLRAITVAGWQAVDLDARAGTVRVARGVLLDLGATAKALAADRAARAAAAHAGVGVLVNLGGDIAVAGPAPPDGWLVRACEDHRDGPGAPGQTVRIASGGVATSSTTVRRWRRGPRDVHHIVDPATGLPAAEVWRTACVAAATCVEANTASTAAIVRGAAAPAWLAAAGLPARLVAADGSVTAVGGWPVEELAA